MEVKTKEVWFNIWCQKCAHGKKEETEDPCNECLAKGWNIETHKPINYKEKYDGRKK